MVAICEEFLMVEVNYANAKVLNLAICFFFMLLTVWMFVEFRRNKLSLSILVHTFLLCCAWCIYTVIVAVIF